MLEQASIFYLRPPWIITHNVAREDLLEADLTQDVTSTSEIVSILLNSLYLYTNDVRINI